MRDGRRRGELRPLLPQLVGYLASVAALTDAYDVTSTVGAVRELVTADEVRRGVMFADRIAERAAEEARR